MPIAPQSLGGMTLRPARATRKWRRNVLELLKTDSEMAASRRAALAQRTGAASGRVRLRCGSRLGSRVWQASQHGDQRAVAKDGEPFAGVEPGGGVFERLSVVELRRRDGGLDVDLATPAPRRLGEEGFVSGPQRRVRPDGVERVVVVTPS